jgi:hypothetical protein
MTALEKQNLIKWIKNEIHATRLILEISTHVAEADKEKLRNYKLILEVLQKID